ncbi:MAG: polysaccharide biosynthesis C-terminal domain-containing protein [Candidatus Poribacteria bacterium]|nr:polysaccharide biosynthesis C-terminal domain-containing protein [Candidatus Poribacteria bacterium]
MLKKLLRHNTFWVMVVTFVGMGLSLLVRAILIPKRFDIGITSDALITALKVVLLVDTVVREGAKFSLVPLFITCEKEMTDTEYQRFTNNLLNFLLCVGLGVFILIELCAPWIVRALSSTIDAQKTTTLLRLCAPLIVFGCGSTVLGALLNSRQHFKTVALRNALPAGVAAAVFLLLWSTENLENWIAIAYTGGFVLYFGWLCIGMHRTGHRFQFEGISLGTLRSLKNTVTLPTLGFAVRQVTNRLLVEVSLVSQLGSGAVTLYECAFRIFSALQTLIGISIATTGLPDMATQDVEDNQFKLRRTLNRNIATAFCIALPVTLLLLLSHTKIVSLLYTGNKFDQTSIQQIAQVLFWLSTGMIFSCLIPVLNAGLYAQKAYGLIFRNMVTMAILNFALAYGFVKAWGLLGIALAVSVTAVLAVVNLTYLLRKTGIVLLQRD